MTLNKIMDEFNDMYGLEAKPIYSDLDGMMKIIGSEYDELTEEYCEPCDGIFCVPSPEDFVKEGVDLIYATAQQLRERGVDVDAALAEVHRSNMSKSLDLFDPQLANLELIEAKKRYPDAELIPHSNKFIIKCAKTGKVIKPTTYSPANITIEMTKGN